jgi:hypothetical protein
VKSRLFSSLTREFCFNLIYETETALPFLYLNVISPGKSREYEKVRKMRGASKNMRKKNYFNVINAKRNDCFIRQ